MHVTCISFGISLCMDTPATSFVPFITNKKILNTGNLSVYFSNGMNFFSVHKGYANVKCYNRFVLKTHINSLFGLIPSHLR